MNISEKVRIHTAASHLFLEKLIVGQIRSLQCKEDYGVILNLFHGYFAGLESRIEAFITEKELPDIHQRRKSFLISEDLRCIGVPHTEQAAPDLLPQINDVFPAFGAMYVMEGSTLGGTHIAGMIQKKLPGIPFAMRFFTGYGEKTMEKWEIFKKVLNHLPNDEEDTSLILSAAEQTFNKFTEWIQYTPREKELT